MRSPQILELSTNLTNHGILFKQWCNILKSTCISTDIFFQEKNEAQEEENTEMNGNADMNDFTLNLAESSNENSNDAEMSQEKENVFENKEDKTNKSSAALEEENVDSTNDRIKFVGLNSSSEEEEEVKPVSKYVLKIKYVIS